MFFKEVNDIDLGQTTIDNIFIDIYMPMSNGLNVSIYLLGYRYACDSSSSPKFNNTYLSKTLNVPLSDVLAAWDFWESKGIVKKHKSNSIDEFDFSIEFLDLKKIYIENILSPNNSIKSNVNNIVSANEDQNIRRMFNSINKVIGRFLDPNERIEILDMMNKYNMSTDMILCAYEYVKDKSGGSKPVRYIEGIIRNWYDSNLYTPEEVKESFAMRNERYMIYKTIFSELGFSRQPSKSEKDTMDSWIDKMNLDIELILEACSKSKNVSNPSIAYINGILKSWNEKNIKNLDDLRKSEEEFKSQKKSIQKTNVKQNAQANNYPKTKFHNFDETFTKYSPEELEKLIEQSQKDKFK